MDLGMDITYQAIAVILKRLEDAFPNQHVADDVITDGVPRDMASAQALANKRDDRCAEGIREVGCAHLYQEPSGHQRQERRGRRFSTGWPISTLRQPRRLRWHSR